MNEATSGADETVGVNVFGVVDVEGTVELGLEEVPAGDQDKKRRVVGNIPREKKFTAGAFDGT